ncbi:Beta-N-acetylhexosaminidase [Catenulispora acidiphila DSM 44928]|uniref:Beta-N-acetylhexosaminidase n=1 Tax=Catenulispora acidiphila (strain DSM 44928 / JCM 14897 / NBRC 102108 / NRRL B-24433 / ID139908) TaxID=479433 RepID=C7Q669_CATAD|nr:glycoside hydrolase family 3 N-terminal domain-containing protein [Catenulispora acidiphila]ACU72075.1 Beta-N-acetylhexosaminidase [Catenulispora acidiphila DSM 44928]
MADAGMRSGRGKKTGGVAAVTLVAAVGLLSGACSSGASKPAAQGSSSSSSTTTSSTPTTTSSSSTPTTTSSSSSSSSSAPSSSSSSTTPKPPTTPSSSPAAPGNLTLQQEAGQRVIYSYQGLTPPQHLLTLIRQGDVGGVIFFGGNISSQSQIAGVITELRQAQAASPVHLPLLLMTDQEGGIVKRLPGPPYDSAKQVGQSSNPPGAATAQGTAAGQNMAGVGMNLNLAPVLDVYRTPGNFLDAAQRSFSQNPNTVSQLGSNFIVAQQNTGVAATAKHFPGLGSAPNGANTDEHPVTLTVSLSNLRSIDELPYAAAVQNGLKLVMMSWAIYPALDANRPAGMSSTIVQQELRDRVGFKGVTITDALEAGALQAYGTAGNRALSAAEAGMDLLLCSSGDPAQGDAAAAALVAAVNNGKLSRSGFDAAVGRVDALRGGLK